MFFFVFGPIRRLYAFVESIELPSTTSSRGLTTFVLDAVAAEPVDAGDADSDKTPVAIARLLSTPRRLMVAYGLPRELREGDWVEIEVADGPQLGLPRIWLQQLPGALGEVFGPLQRGAVTSLRLLDDDGETFRGGPVRPFGYSPRDERIPASTAFLAMRKGLVTAPANLDLQVANGGFELAIRQILSPELHPRLLDLGQAQCVAFHEDKDPGSKVHFLVDCGYPTPWNARTAPKQLPGLRFADDCFGLIGHWDYDHYSLPYRLPDLSALPWYAPWQPVGKGCARFQSRRLPRLTFIDGAVSYGAFALVRGGGGDRNGSGYAVRFQSRHGSCLIPGDVAYGFLPAHMLNDLDALVGTHHLGHGAENPPRPNGSALLGIACGLGNKHGHPFAHHLTAHEALGWKPFSTAGHRSNGAMAARRDVWLLPPAVSVQVPIPVAAE